MHRGSCAGNAAASFQECQKDTEETISITSLQLLPLLSLTIIFPSLRCRCATFAPTLHLPSSLHSHLCSFSPASSSRCLTGLRGQMRGAGERRLVTRHRGCKQGSREVGGGQGGGGGSHWEITQRLQRVNWRECVHTSYLVFCCCFFFSLRPSPDSPAAWRLFTSASINWQLPLLKFRTCTSTFQNVLAQQPR